MNIDTSAKTPGWSSLENYDAPGGSVMTSSEVSHSNELEQYVSHKHLVTLFYDKERADSLAAFSVDLLAKYPDYPYHQAAHGVDVMRSLRLLLTDIIPADSLSLYQKDLLLEAAAAHDALVHLHMDIPLKNIMLSHSLASNMNLIQLSMSSWKGQFSGRSLVQKRGFVVIVLRLNCCIMLILVISGERTIRTF